MSKIRNAYVFAMTLRHSYQEFKDKRKSRGGAKNIQQEYLEEYDLSNESDQQLVDEAKDGYTT